MHDIKFIKENKTFFEESMKKRNIKISANKIVEIYNSYLDSLNQVQKYQEKKNILSKQISTNSELNENEIKKISSDVKTLKENLENYKNESSRKKNELDEYLMQLPNLIDNKTPLGSSEKDNKLIKENGNKPKFTFKPKNHLEIAERLNLIDYKKAIKISGSRFSILKSELSLLHRALMNYMLDINTQLFQYTECSVPEMVKDECLFGTGQLPKFGEDLFKTNFNNLWLIPTAEVPLTNFHRDDIIDLKNLPLRYTAYTNCFRAEAGAAGKDTKGLMREHQFGKVELVSIVHPDESFKELDRMTKCVEKILLELNLPYRMIELCSADLGFSSSYTIDFEVWMPGQNKYREVSSCSNCKDFQSRRMKTRVKNFNDGKIFFPHTLNGSSVAVGRLLIAIIENYQSEEGFINIPKVLDKYMNGVVQIKG
ncbi:MAG: serine--tRNA ligase [Alphaproteobacteria bacterium]